MTAVMEEVEQQALPTPEEVVQAIQSGTTAEVVLGQPLILRMRSLERQIREVNDLITSEREAHAEWLDRLQDRCAEEADDNEWCGEFERFMENAGLEGRRATEIEVTATLLVRMSVDDSDAEALFDRINGIDTDASYFDGCSAEVTCRLAVSATATARRGECACGDIDWSEHTPSWVDNYCTYEVEESRCDHCD